MDIRDKYWQMAKEFAATYCTTLSDKQHAKFVDALTELLRSVAAEAKR